MTKLHVGYLVCQYFCSVVRFKTYNFCGASWPPLPEWSGSNFCQNLLTFRYLNHDVQEKVIYLYQIKLKLELKITTILEKKRSNIPILTKSFPLNLLKLVTQHKNCYMHAWNYCCYELWVNQRHTCNSSRIMQLHDHEILQKTADSHTIDWYFYWYTTRPWITNTKFVLPPLQKQYLRTTECSACNVYQPHAVYIKTMKCFVVILVLLTPLPCHLVSHTVISMATFMCKFYVFLFSLECK